MAIETRERPTTSPGVKPKPVEISQQAPAQPANREPQLNVPANTRAVRSAGAGKTRKGGLIRGWARALSDVSFQLGLGGPARLWYRDSQRLSAKEKAELDIRLRGIFH